MNIDKYGVIITIPLNEKADMELHLRHMKALAEGIPDYRGKASSHESFFEIYLNAYGIDDRLNRKEAIAEYAGYLDAHFLRYKYMYAFNYMKENHPDIVAEKFQDTLDIQKEEEALWDMYQKL